MKTKIILVVVCVFFLSQNAFSAIKVKFFLGDVEYLPKTETSWKKISMGQNMQIGDSIKTNAKAYIELDLDANYIKINENSKVKLSQSMEDNKTSSSLSMQYGNVMLKMDKLKKENKNFEVDTPSSVAAVRGTEFLIAAGHDGKTIIQVQEGSVAFIGDSAEVQVQANQESTVSMGGNPSPVKIIQKRQWNEWLADSEKNIKGNEDSLLEACLNKMKKLDNDIAILESELEKYKKEQKDYDDKMKEAISAKDKAKAKEYAELSYKSGRLKGVAMAKAGYQAERIDLIMELATKIFKSMDQKSINKKTESIYQQMQEIYNLRYNKYILDIKQEQNRLKNKGN